MKFTALILAGGSSSRFKENKLLVHLGRRTILDLTISNFRKADVSEIVVVTGEHDRAIRSSVGEHNIRFVHNTDHSRGMSSSVRCGLQAISTIPDGIFITPGDIPLFSSKTVRSMMSALPGNSAVIPVHDGTKGHPVLLSRQTAKNCLRLTSDKILYECLSVVSDSIKFLPVEDRGILLDLDSPEDFGRLSSYYESITDDRHS